MKGDAHENARFWTTNPSCQVSQDDNHISYISYLNTYILINLMCFRELREGRPWIFIIIIIIFFIFLFYFSQHYQQ